MESLIANTQSCSKQQDTEPLIATPETTESSKPGVTEPTTNMNDETSRHGRQQITTAENTEHQAASPASPTTENIPLQDQDPETAPLFHFYTCCKLSFLIKMASLQHVKALGYALSDEGLNWEEKSMEDSRTRALDAWEQIHARGFSYDAVGAEYLRLCALR